MDDVQLLVIKLEGAATEIQRVLATSRNALNITRPGSAEHMLIEKWVGRLELALAEIGRNIATVLPRAIAAELPDLEDRLEYLRKEVAALDAPPPPAQGDLFELPPEPELRFKFESFESFKRRNEDVVGLPRPTRGARVVDTAGPGEPSVVLELDPTKGTLTFLGAEIPAAAAPDPEIVLEEDPNGPMLDDGVATPGTPEPTVSDLAAALEQQRGSGSDRDRGSPR